MHPNEKLINRLYDAFDKKDYRTMQECYHPEAVFSDPVFQHLSATEVRAMWHMLIVSASDLKIRFNRVKADDGAGTCRWEAWYTFSGTGRPVHNMIAAQFTFRDGKILRHDDTFDFWRWSRMALGSAGMLLGWTPYLRKKVRTKARKRLALFMEENRV